MSFDAALTSIPPPVAAAFIPVRPILIAKLIKKKIIKIILGKKLHCGQILWSNCFVRIDVARSEQQKEKMIEKK